MIETIIFFGAAFIAMVLMAIGCSQINRTPDQKHKELEELKRNQRVFWTSYMN